MSKHRHTSLFKASRETSSPPGWTRLKLLPWETSMRHPRLHWLASTWRSGGSALSPASLQVKLVMAASLLGLTPVVRTQSSWPYARAAQLVKTASPSPQPPSVCQSPAPLPSTQSGHSTLFHQRAWVKPKQRQTITSSVHMWTLYSQTLGSPGGNFSTFSLLVGFSPPACV